MIQNIRHIIFDLGGVLLNLDTQKTTEAFKDLGIAHFAEWQQQPEVQALFIQFELGRIDRAVFFQTINRMSGKKLNHQDMAHAWNAMLLEFPLRRLQILQQLQIHFDLVLLSNTNEVHEECFNTKLKTQTGFNNLNVFFDRVYFSHRSGLRKPNPETFQRVLSETGFKPEYSLFIDDLPENIAAAQELGVQAIWLQPGMTIEEHIFRNKP
ncbi:MAG TPA: HAD family phosphatase [Edaphocola sp.]|nr:HAD family phosphatase [Edaphocola sp.]